MSSCNAHADVQDLSFAAMQQMILFEAAEHALPVLKNQSDVVEIESEFGRFSISQRDAGLRISLSAETQNDLHVIREGIIEHLAHYLPDVADSLTWSDGLKTEQHPPNFQFAKILSSKPLNAEFHRLALRLQKPELFDDRALHFRFLIPEDNRVEPAWPTLGPNGAVKWPKDEKALHRPVYTVRRLDQTTGVASVDVFNHTEGRAFEWAQGVQEGDEIAIIGPGGGGIVTTDDLVICGDEAAYPAIARILDVLPGARGEVILLSSSDHPEYDMTLPTGMGLTWLRPTDKDTLSTAASDALFRHPKAYFWFAADNQQAGRVRKIANVAAHPKQQRMIAAYWTKLDQSG